MLIDTHAHLNFNVYKDDVDEVIKRALKNDVWMINIGTKYETSKKALEFTEKYPQGIFAAIGLHPIYLETGLVKIKNDDEEVELKTREESFDYEKYKELAKSSKVVAIGEIGLDYYWKPKTSQKKELFKQKQKELLLEQLKLAKELNLPVIFHCRMAHQDLIEILKAYSGMPLHSQRQTHGLPKARSGSFLRLPGVIHCFTGTLEQAQKYLEMGFYLGFNGLIFKPVPHRTEGSGAGMNQWDEIIKKTPLDKILIETDCPYLTPPQIKGRNEPLYVQYIAQRIAEIKNISYDEVAETTTKNAKKLFNL